MVGARVGQLKTRGVKSVNCLLFTAFNREHGCFASGIESRVRVYNADGVIGHIEMLFRCPFNKCDHSSFS
uniref:Uncharacterized protein n=1 Tax=Eptatretus burgeri TaxID=7764 RepID=A0A8C4QZX2_EPTBU